MGIDHIALSSQRTGKDSLLYPALAFHLSGADQKELFAADRNDVKRRVEWYSWGFVEVIEGKEMDVHVTTAFSSVDVVSVRVEVFNHSASDHSLILHWRSAINHADREPVIGAEEKTVFLSHTSAPTEIRKLRGPKGARLSSRHGRASRVRGHGFEALPEARAMAGQSRPFQIHTGQRVSFGFRLSSAAQDFEQGTNPREADARLRHIVSDKAPRAARSDQAILEAQNRWKGRLTPLLEHAEPAYRPMLTQAVTVLERNTVQPSLRSMARRWAGTPEHSRR